MDVGKWCCRFQICVPVVTTTYSVGVFFSSFNVTYSTYIVMKFGIVFGGADADRLLNIVVVRQLDPDV